MLSSAYVATILTALAVADRAPGPALEKIDQAPKAALETALDRGVTFLVGCQNRDGSWGSPRRTKGLNIYAPAPGAHHAFRAAVTGLCVAAMIEAAPENPQTRRAVARAGEWFLKELPKLRRATADAIYNVWGHAYAIQGLVRLVE